MAQDTPPETMTEADAAKARLRRGLQRSRAVVEEYRGKLAALRKASPGSSAFAFGRAKKRAP